MAFGAKRDYILDNFGRPLSGVSVTVKYNTVGDGSGASPGDLAPLKTDRAGGTPLANPFTNESDGSWIFWADTRNTYDIEFSKSGVTFDNTDFTDMDTGFVAAGTVGTTELADGSVTTIKLAATAVTAAKIAANTITAAQIAATTITDAEIAGSGITTRGKLPAALAYEDEINTFVTGQTIQGDGTLLKLARPDTDPTWIGIEWVTNLGVREALFYYDTATNQIRIENATTTMALVDFDTGQFAADYISPTDAAPATPVANAIYKQNVVKGWANIYFSSGTPTLADYFNVSSLTDNGGLGDVEVIWATAFANASYAMTGGAVFDDKFVTFSTFAVGSVDCHVWDASAAAEVDASFFVIAIGAQ